MKNWIYGAIFAGSLLNATAYADASCSNRALACRISGAAVNLYNQSSRVGYHPYLVNASAQLNEVASDFCYCNYSRFNPGSGILMDRYHYVRYVYNVISGRGDITPAETDAMNHLISVVGQP